MPQSQIGTLAGRLFQRMQFSSLYDRDSGLFHGGLRLQPQGKWKVDSWTYQYFGSESRTLYAVAYALGLVNDRNFLKKLFASSSKEVFLWNGKPLLGLWDGGTFQLLLPRLLLHEELYSSRFREFYQSYLDFVIHEGIRRGLPLPASHSASEFANDYNGKSGSPYLVSSDNQDILDPKLLEQWDAVISPHAVIMTWAIEPGLIDSALERAEVLGSSETKFYHATLGWMDGLYVKTSLSGRPTIT
ncbi:hypothetical protein WDW37_15360 [Bdellovibrionota bacterium FG-1]